MEYLSRFAICRDIGHQWDISMWSNGKRSLICDNCTTQRHDAIDQHGKITGRTYKYPSGYHYKRTPKVIRDLRLQLEKEARKLDRWVGSRAHLRLVKKIA